MFPFCGSPEQHKPLALSETSGIAHNKTNAPATMSCLVRITFSASVAIVPSRSPLALKVRPRFIIGLRVFEIKPDSHVAVGDGAVVVALAIVRDAPVVVSDGRIMSSFAM